ncbi:MAG: hypothetical protein AB1918_07310 [Pseudomonadota bacterium]
MKTIPLMLLAVTAIGLGAEAAVAAGDAHSHAASTSELMLNNGAKWPTDGALRHGMSEIRALVADALPKVHAGRFLATDYQRLADSVLGQIEGIAANCKLPPEVDAQLHLVLARIIDGAETIKTGKAPVDGVVAVMGGIDAYGEHFDHPGWQPLKH